VTTPSNDWDRDEREALQPFQEELWALQDRHAGDPPLERLRAAKADALPADLQASTTGHLSGSRWSRVLVEDAEACSSGLDPDQEARLLDRIRREAASETRWRFLRPRVLSSLAAAAAVVVIAVAIVQRSRELPTAPAARGASATAARMSATPTLPRFQLALEKPDVKLGPRALTYRGDAGGGNFVSQLKPALDAFRESDYARADRELGELATRYPQAVEVFFYQGVARLFLNDIAGADASLSAADRLADESFAADVAWYRAIVDERLGRLAEARARLTGLCREGHHERQRAACEAVTRLP
jgi:hypothetical protein